MAGPHGRLRKNEGEENERDALAPPPRPTSLDRYRRWRRLLDTGVYASQAALSRAEGVSRAAVTLGLQRLEAADRAGEAVGGGPASDDAL